MEPLKRADIRAFVGATGSGKGVGIHEHLGKINPSGPYPSRFAAFDPLWEYGKYGTAVRTVREAIRGMKQARFRVVWQPAQNTDYTSKAFKDDFKLWCMACFEAADLVMLVEELELVTSPSSSPAEWRMCTKRGRHQRLVILAATQRPADADKAFWSSCTYIRCHALRETGDKDRMAKVLDVPYEQINALKTIAKSDVETHITYYEKDFNQSSGGQKTVVLRRK